MRSVSEMSQPSYKTMRIIDNKLCSIIKEILIITNLIDQDRVTLKLIFLMG